MRPDSIAAILPLLASPPRLNVWQWAEASIDYSRVRNYDTEWRGPYSADYMPYWREPMEAITDPDVREVWILKCSRAGGSENVLLTPLRYVVACAPQPILYVSGQEGSTGKFLETRIKPGFALAEGTREAYERARVRE
jgi:phage terminase large subunit GpA-like protein